MIIMMEGFWITNEHGICQQIPNPMISYLHDIFHELLLLKHFDIIEDRHHNLSNDDLFSSGPLGTKFSEI